MSPFFGVSATSNGAPFLSYTEGNVLIHGYFKDLVGGELTAPCGTRSVPLRRFIIEGAQGLAPYRPSSTLAKCPGGLMNSSTSCAASACRV